MRCQCVTFAANQRQTADDTAAVVVVVVGIGIGFGSGCLGGGGLGGRAALGALTATKM